MAKFQKPYPNFHAARIRRPGDFVNIVVLDTLPNGVMLYGGRLKTDPRGASKIQAIRFPREKFTPAQAKEWLRDHNHRWLLFEEATGEKKKRTEPIWPSISGEVVDD